MYIKELTKENKEFLKGYTPKNKHFTSYGECEMVKKELGLLSMSAVELNGCRNAVVQFYTELLGSPKQGSIDYMQSMMSVTAVIDNVGGLCW